MKTDSAIRAAFALALVLLSLYVAAERGPVPPPQNLVADFWVFEDSPQDADADGFNASGNFGDYDCNDYNQYISPAAREDCDDGVDNDCDGWLDEDDSECIGALFTDVGVTHQFYDYIYAVWAAQYEPASFGLTEECTTLSCCPADAYHYCPEDGMIRSEFAVYLARAIGLDPYYPSTATFVDVPAGSATANRHWAYGYIEALHKNGWTSIFESGDSPFYPNFPVSRVQAAIYITRLVKATRGDNISCNYRRYCDVDESHWAFEEICGGGTYIDSTMTSRCYSQQSESYWDAWCPDNYPTPFCPTSLVYTDDIGINNLCSPSHMWDYYYGVDQINRGEMAYYMIDRCRNYYPEFVPCTEDDTCPARPSFSDVPTTHQYYGYIEKAYAEGIIAGYPAQISFHPEYQMERWEAAVVMANAMGLDTSNPPVCGSESYSDVPCTHEAYAEIEALYREGAACGKLNELGERVFNPYNPLTRGEAAKIFANAFLDTMKGGWVAGTVETGASPYNYPLRGAQLELCSFDDYIDDYVCNYPLTAETNDYGEYEFYPLETGSYILDAYFPPDEYAPVFYYTQFSWQDIDMECGVGQQRNINSVPEPTVSLMWETTVGVDGVQEGWEDLSYEVTRQEVVTDITGQIVSRIGQPETISIIVPSEETIFAGIHGAWLYDQPPVYDTSYEYCVSSIDSDGRVSEQSACVTVDTTISPVVSASLGVRSAMTLTTTTITPTTTVGTTTTVPGYDATCVSMGAPYTIYPGESVIIDVTMLNNGTNTWTKAKNYKLGSQSPTDNLVWGRRRAEMLSNASVSPGDRYTFKFSITAPTAEGVYACDWEMLRAGSGNESAYGAGDLWFGETCRSDIFVTSRWTGATMCPPGSSCWATCADDRTAPDCFDRTKVATSQECSDRGGVCCESARMSCPKTVTTTTSTTTTIRRPPPYVRRNFRMNMTRNTGVDVDATDVGTRLRITPRRNMVNEDVTVNVNNTFRSPMLYGSGRYFSMSASPELEGNISSVLIELYYDDYEVAGLNESTLGLYFYSDGWKRATKDMAWVYDSGLETGLNYVWANVSRFETLTIGGEPMLYDVEIPLAEGWNLISFPVED